jgi:hypothetical protein
MNVPYVGKIIHSTSASSAFYTTPLTAVIYRGKPDINTTSTTPVTTAALTVGASNSTNMHNSNGIMTSTSINAVPSDEEWESVTGNSNSNSNSNNGYSSGKSSGSGSSRASSSDSTVQRSSNSSI